MTTMSKGMIWLIVIVIVIVGGFFLLSSRDSSEIIAPPTSPDGDATIPVSDGEVNGIATPQIQISMTSAGFSPEGTTIKKGQTVTFVNEDTSSHWPASAMHPTHTVYPGSDIDKCGTSEAAMIFDACSDVLSGESYSFTFHEVGEWKYHDHLNPTMFGSITVTE